MSHSNGEGTFHGMKGGENGTGTKKSRAYPPVRRNLWYPKVARLSPRPRVRSITLHAEARAGAVLLWVSCAVWLAVLRVRESVRVWLKGAMGHRKWLGGLERDDVLWVREVEVLCMADGSWGALEVELSRGCSLGGGEGGVGLLIRDDCHIIGRKPSTLLTEQTIPPSGFQPGEDLNDVVSAEGEGGVVIGLVVEECAAEKGGEELFLLRLLLGGVGTKRHGLCSRVEDFSGHCETRRLA